MPNKGPKYNRASLSEIVLERKKHRCLVVYHRSPWEVRALFSLSKHHFFFLPHEVQPPSSSLQVSLNNSPAFLGPCTAHLQGESFYFQVNLFWGVCVTPCGVLFPPMVVCPKLAHCPPKRKISHKTLDPFFSSVLFFLS
jgi:hypothetical protein